MMLGEESRSAEYWKKCGDEAIANGCKGVIMMVSLKILEGTILHKLANVDKGAHWDTKGDNRIEVATKPDPEMNPVAYVRPDKYVGYKINVDLPTANRCISMLKDGGLNAHPNPSFDWIHDSFLILIRMFPDGCPPTVLISQNARYDPHFHVRVGSILRPLREEGYLIIGSGGAVHNLYRNVWTPMLRYRDNFAMPSPPGDWALDFRQAFEDAMTKHSGLELRKAVTRLMKHPKFRDAHGTDEHFIPATFVAGAAGDIADTGTPGSLCAEDWELVSPPR
jgi:aromatic ring-opening dioxygenase catalytic subunit (LigB family)